MSTGSILFVKGCVTLDENPPMSKRCPFYADDEGGACVHPEAPRPAMGTPAWTGPTGKAPDWCPLTQNPVLVRRM